MIKLKHLTKSRLDSTIGDVQASKAKHIGKLVEVKADSNTTKGRIMDLWNVDKIPFVGTENPAEGLGFHYYDPERVVAGKKMKDWLRFAVAYWHTFNAQLNDNFGDPTAIRPWHKNTYSKPLDASLALVDYAFEFMSKLGVEYFCFHDRNVAPEGDTLRETDKNLDAVIDKIEENMKATGIKLLWNTCDTFTDKRFVRGASTAPNRHIFEYVAGQQRKSLEIAKRLGAENYVFWGGREGWESLWNTDVKREQDHMAEWFRMCHEYAEKIGLDAQFLIEPKPQEPTTHQYDWDVAAALNFIKTYDLDFFRMNIEGNHANLARHSYGEEVRTAVDADKLGSLDANQGNKFVGWDMDEFPIDLYDTTQVMWEVMRAGSIGPKGGLNFDAKPRRTSFEPEDLFRSHIAGMDSYAAGLLVADKMHQDHFIENLLDDRYASWNTPEGKAIEEHKETLESLESRVLDMTEEQLVAGNKSDHLESVMATINNYMIDALREA